MPALGLFVTSWITSLFLSNNAQALFQTKLLFNQDVFFFAVEYGSWFDYTLDWEKVIKHNPDHPFLVLSYENLKAVSLYQLFNIAVI